MAILRIVMIVSTPESENRKTHDYLDKWEPGFKTSAPPLHVTFKC